MHFVDEPVDGFLALRDELFRESLNFRGNIPVAVVELVFDLIQRVLADVLGFPVLRFRRRLFDPFIRRGPVEHLSRRIVNFFEMRADRVGKFPDHRVRPAREIEARVTEVRKTDLGEIPEVARVEPGVKLVAAFFQSFARGVGPRVEPFDELFGGVEDHGTDAVRLANHRSDLAPGSEASDFFIALFEPFLKLFVFLLQLLGAGLQSVPLFRCERPPAVRGPLLHLHRGQRKILFDKKFARVEPASAFGAGAAADLVDLQKIVRNSRGLKVELRRAAFVAFVRGFGKIRHRLLVLVLEFDLAVQEQSVLGVGERARFLF